MKSKLNIVLNGCLRRCAELRSPGLSHPVYRGTDRRAVFGIYRNGGLLQRLTTTCCRLWKFFGSTSPAVVLGKCSAIPHRLPAAAMAGFWAPSAVDAWRMANATTTWEGHDASP